MLQENYDMTASITAIVPVYNEEQFLQQSVSRLLEVEEIDTIYLVDDCSVDSSWQIMEQLLLSNDKISLLQTDKNGGKGKAICSVQKHLTTDYVIIHDADLEYYPKDIKKLIEKIDINNPNLVLGSRFLHENKKQIYLRTFLANKFLSRVFSIVYFVKVTDVATCYKLMPVEYFKNTQFFEKGFAIEVELLSKYFKFNKTKNFSEVPINYKARSYKDGKKIKLKDGFKYLFAMFKYRF